MSTRSSEEHFQKMLIELNTLTKQYEQGQIKYHQKTIKVDTIFENYGWSRHEFFKELNSRLGIQSHSDRAAKKPKGKNPTKLPRGVNVEDLIPLNDDEKACIRDGRKTDAVRRYRKRVPDASLYITKYLCDKYANVYYT
jgi:hypothetical protein